MSNCIGAFMNEKRDFREETQLSSSEEIALKYAAGRLGMSKAGILRLGLLQLVDNLRRNEVLSETGIVTED